MKTKRRFVAGIETAVLNCTDISFSKHSHDEFYVGANIVGREYIWLDGKSLEASVSDVTLYNPGQIQAANAERGDWHFISIYVDPPEIERLFNLPITTCFERSVVTNDVLANRIRAFGQFCLRDQQTDEQVEEQAAILLMEAFTFSGTIAKDLSLRDSDILASSVADRLRDCMLEPPSLDILAFDAGLSPVQLLRVFSRRFGLPPFAWLNVQRLKTARHMLRTEKRLATIATDLGFADQAHFTRRFKEMYGISPGLWRRSC